MLALELPTGGLAEVLGRRPVVVAGAVLHVASCLVVAASSSFAGFFVGVLLLGVVRALNSGPLEAWWVYTVEVLDPAADVAPGLAKHTAGTAAGSRSAPSSAGCCPACSTARPAPRWPCRSWRPPPSTSCTSSPLCG